MKAEALELGFRHVESGPLVRSSYHARDQVPGAELRRVRRQATIDAEGRIVPGGSARTGRARRLNRSSGADESEAVSQPPPEPPRQAAVAFALTPIRPRPSSADRSRLDDRGARGRAGSGSDPPSLAGCEPIQRGRAADRAVGRPPSSPTRALRSTAPAAPGAPGQSALDDLAIAVDQLGEDAAPWGVGVGAAAGPPLQPALELPALGVATDQAWWAWIVVEPTTSTTSAAGAAAAIERLPASKLCSGVPDLPTDGLVLVVTTPSGTPDSIRVPGLARGWLARRATRRRAADGARFGGFAQRRRRHLPPRWPTAPPGRTAATSSGSTVKARAASPYAWASRRQGCRRIARHRAGLSSGHGDHLAQDGPRGAALPPRRRGDAVDHVGHRPRPGDQAPDQGLLGIPGHDHRLEQAQPELRRLPPALPLDRADPVLAPRRRAVGLRGRRRRLPQEQHHHHRAALQPDEAQPGRRAGPRPHHRGGGAGHGPGVARVPGQARA